MTIVRPALAALLATVCAVGCWQVLAADPPSPPALKLPAELESCSACHENGRQRFQALESHHYFKLNELETWVHHDPHSKAFDVLLNSDAGREMAKNYQDRNGTAYNFSQDARCLTCHAMDTKPTEAINALSEQDVLKRFIGKQDLGIGCTACHGLTNKKWVGEHIQIKEWREIHPTDKQKVYGLTNLRDPETKAQLCLSCHIGSVAEHRVITHEMYAYGHPPLPPLELMSFVDDQPRHFFLPDEVAKTQDDKIKAPYVPPTRDYKAWHVMVGAITSLKAESELIAEEAKQRGVNGPDYARFDCYACHHNLVPGSDRIVRGYGDRVPGRPPLKAWNAALAQAVVDFTKTAPDAELKAVADRFGGLWDTLAKAGHAKGPFGDAGDLQTAAGAMSKWCQDFLNALNAKENAKYPDAAGSVELQKAIEKVALDPRYVADPEAVMVLVWADRALDKTNDARDWSKVDVALPSSVRPDASKAATKPVTAGEVLKDRMEVFNKYKVAAFRQAFPPAKVPSPQPPPKILK